MWDNEGVSDLSQVLAGARRAALIPFIPAGFPHADSTPSLLRTLAEAGADVIEVGVPFSDPMADGGAIQQANMVALENGTTLPRVLEQVQAFCELGYAVPIVLMGYTNSFVNYGRARFTADAKAAGVAGVIMVDLDDADSAQWGDALHAAGIALIRLVAPTTPPARVAHIAKCARGFVYYVALRGITGAGHLQTETVAAEVRALRQMLPVPLAVGFGIQTPAQARAIADAADGVVVGSALVRLIQQTPPEPAHAEALLAAVHQFTTALKEAVA